MLSESFVAATLTAGKISSQLPSNLKDVGICLHEIQPQTSLRHGYKKSSVNRNCLAISENHIFAAQAEKAVVNVYSREKGNQEATVPFPERIHSLACVDGTGILVIGTEGGKLILWETATGRLTNSSASHLQAVTSLCITENLSLILSASSDSEVHIWSLQGLIAFPQPSNSYSHDTSKSPIRTFSGHRNPVTAIACGHSRSHTAFAISCSQDHTCYIWSISDCQVLQTYLLPSTPLCFSVDIADRAVYAGYEDGSIQAIDLYKRSTQDTGESLYNGNGPTAIQLTEKECWPPSTTASDPANCTTLSYDGTMLLSGHKSGKIISWDVAKGRLRNQILDLGQPVTNIRMLRPAGLPIETSNFQIKTIVKPRVDLTTYTGDGSSGLPPGYNFHAKITPRKTGIRYKDPDDFQDILACKYFSQDTVDSAIYELRSSTTFPSGNSQSSEKDAPQINQLQQEVTKLNTDLDILRAAIGKSRERRLKRIEKRELFTQRKREALQQAGKGRKGDAVRAEWEKKEQTLDQESDEEELAQEVYSDLR
jgi:pre-rRNA-processing protein IPI3